MVVAGAEPGLVTLCCEALCMVWLSNWITGRCEDYVVIESESHANELLPGETHTRISHS